MRSVPLSDVCKIVNGGTPKSGVVEYWGGDIAWLTPAEMGKRTTPFIAKTARTISRTGLANCSARQVPAGAVIMSTRAPIGHLAIPETPMAFNQGCRGLIPNENLDTKFLYYFLWFSRDALNELGTGATFKELASSALGNFTIPLPSLEEQRRIVAVLDEAFAAIATATANAEKNLVNTREILTAEAQAIFGNTCGDWVEATLGSVCELYQPQTIGRKDMVDDGPYPVFGANGPIGRHDKFNHEEPQLLVTCRGATCGSVNMSDPFSWITGNAMVVRPRDGTISVGLLRSIFEHAFDFSKVITGAAQPQITRQSFAPSTLTFPPKLEDQAALEERLDALSDSVDGMAECYEAKLEALAKLKQSLLQCAFAGELSAPIPKPALA